MVRISRPSTQSSIFEIGHVMGSRTSMSGTTTLTDAEPIRNPWRLQMDISCSEGGIGGEL